MVKGFRRIASLTAFSRVPDLVRDMAFSYFPGASGVMEGYWFWKYIDKPVLSVFMLSFVEVVVGSGNLVKLAKLRKQSPFIGQKTRF